jgi:hypothetical protein
MADNSVVVKVIVRYDDEVIGCSVMPYFTALGYTMLWERANKVEGLTITIEV